MSAAAVSRPLGPALVGRPFVGTVFDYLVMGGGLSLLVLAVVLSRSDRGGALLSVGLAYAVFFSNSAHFASSTVRLYTKPGAFAAMPFLTMGLPLVSLGLLAACLAWPEVLGFHLVRLYLTWSPYHYAAQAYGLAAVYSYRSGCAIAPGEKRVLWWVAMMPALHAFLTADWAGVHWLLPARWLERAGPAAALTAAHAALPVIGFAAPVAFAAWLWTRPTGPPPLIAILVLLTNAAWWFLLPPLQAFAWATIFHGLQYLGIVTVFHVKDRAAARPDDARPAWRHALTFYAACVALGYVLFNVLPHAGRALGFGLVESLLLVSAAINVHHFIVDAFIWRLKKTDGNRRIVEEPAPGRATTYGAVEPSPATA